MNAGYTDKIFNISHTGEFDSIAIEVFHYQVQYNPVYRQFTERLGIEVNDVQRIEDIPFLPIEFFRNHIVITGNREAEIVFESTGTTGTIKSRHYVTDPRIYEESLLKCFRLFYGDPQYYLIAALLPSYLERQNSSLIYMINKLIESGADEKSSFFERGSWKLIDMLKLASGEGKKVMLIGVSFALLDLAEKFSSDLNDIIIVETGGMKGRRKEITREELHNILGESFNVTAIHSEYGMTELLSQAWSKGKGIFSCPPWMRIFVRELNDPLSVSAAQGKAGAINVIDLANINSCSFIATGDIGRLHSEGIFEVLGRYDHSETRGCNLMAE